MRIGVPAEIKTKEFRVGLTPAGVAVLTKLGHNVAVERGAGVGSGLSDEDYVKAGAEIVPDRMTPPDSSFERCAGPPLAALKTAPALSSPRAGAGPFLRLLIRARAGSVLSSCRCATAFSPNNHGYLIAGQA